LILSRKENCISKNLFVLESSVCYLISAVPEHIGASVVELAQTEVARNVFYIYCKLKRSNFA
jgi:hypothetical protein